jgi:AcrR family transcriptional regulator
MSTPPRRTQRERREATIAKLLDATIICLVDHGYRDTSIARICEEAGVSHGGLFRHFSSRTALIAAAADEIGRRHAIRMQEVFSNVADAPDKVDDIVRYFRSATREPLTAAWREVMTATRTDAELRDSTSDAIHNFENAIMHLAANLGNKGPDDREFGTLILSLLHMFDSEASTVQAFVTKDIEAIRHAWAVGILREALEAK